MVCKGCARCVVSVCACMCVCIRITKVNIYIYICGHSEEGQRLLSFRKRE